MPSFLPQEFERLTKVYIEKTPKSAALYEAARQALPGGNTRNNLYFAPYPPYFEKGEGCFLFDVDGNRYFDFLSDFTVSICGHSNPTLKAEILKVLESGTNFGGCIEAETELATAIQSRFPSMEKLRFVNSGTEANLYALQTALAYSKKSKVIVFSGNYHGGVMNYNQAHSPINVPFDTLILPYNDTAAFEAAITEHNAEVGAVVVELLMNSGGCIPADPAFIQSIRAHTAQFDIPFIIDEVMTARLNYNGLQSQYAVEPDLTTLGKFIGGGFSAGAFGGKHKYMEIFNAEHADFIAHGGSFNNNVFSMKVGAKSLNTILTKEAMTALNEKGEALRIHLNQLFDTANVPLVFTGGGSVMNLHLARTPPTQKNTNPLSKELCALFHKFLLNEGIWVATRSLIALSLETTDQAVSALIKATEKFIDRYAAELKALDVETESNANA
ncbi:MAG: aminotransferase class III-fold pyridoxal phosphate-dependent enzyme [Kordiimonadaceae bacterium]|nr:aminotransferase class III-fold pyridoxal phosphate-dependent enzyme [Kordiimonadaceae bacterium]